MPFYEVITNANEVSVQNDLPDYAHCGPSWKWLIDLIQEGLSFLMCAEASIIWFNISAPVLDYITYTRDLICPLR
jgi:hypothetical protein